MSRSQPSRGQRTLNVSSNQDTLFPQTWWARTGTSLKLGRPQTGQFCYHENQVVLRLLSFDSCSEHLASACLTEHLYRVSSQQGQEADPWPLAHGAWQYLNRLDTQSPLILPTPLGQPRGPRPAVVGHHQPVISPAYRVDLEAPDTASDATRVILKPCVWMEVLFL